MTKAPAIPSHWMNVLFRTKIRTVHRAYFDTKVPMMVHREFIKLGKCTAPRGSFSPSKEARMMFSTDKNALKVIHKSWNDTNSFLYLRCDLRICAGFIMHS